MARLSLPIAMLAIVGLVPPLSAQKKADAREEKEPNKQAASQELTLEKLFPKKGLFGPSASSARFSHDGKYAAYLYRPYRERRHGSDLWLYDVAKGKAQRITSVPVMARFQKATRKVREDRKKKKKGSSLLDTFFGSSSVGADDADAEKSPRYGGVQSFTWSPKGDELLFSSQGDIYRWSVGDDEPTRLTMTREREHSVEYLPDGSGYTFLRGGSGGRGRRSRPGSAGSGTSLIRVEFGSHLVSQLDPDLPTGESMTGYRFSDDGKRVVFLTSKGRSSGQSGSRKVNIARYRDRFMDVQEVSRHVSDDPMPKVEMAVYLYDFAEPMVENGTLTRVHRFTVTNPRDTFGVPNWSHDSKRVVFTAYDAETGQVHVMQADGGSKEKKKKAGKGAADKAEKGGRRSRVAVKDSGKGDEKGGKKAGEAGADEPKAGKDEILERPADVVYRFLHTGGPTTPRMITPHYLGDSHHIVFLSEQSGFRHLHVLDPMYESVRPLTHGHFEVYPIEMSKDHKWMFVTATKEDSACQDVYRVALADGRMERLTRQRGYYSSVAVSPDGSTLLASFARFGSPRELVAVTGESGEQNQLTRSHPKTTLPLVRARPTFFTYDNRHGQKIHGHMFKPADWSPADKRPLLIYVYGGPLGTRKNVVEGSFGSDGYLFAQYMTRRHGYVTCTIDPRGMSGYGGKFEKANYEQVGKPQVEDLVDGVKFMVEHHGVDAKRVGIHGWSFGGFQTQMCLYTEPDVFACGIAGAGPTEWENYNSWYSLGTIGPSRTGQADLKKFSLLPLAKNLKGRLLLVHGMEDSNVLYQDTVRVYRELLKADKETLVELFLDPTGGHGLGGDVKRLGKARKYEEFFVRVLGKGERSREALDATIATRETIIR